MQKLISKYGLAAHLALLAVAPLIVFPYLPIAESGKVILWLSLLAVVWFLNAPSRIANERSTSEARRRISAALKTDALFWLLLAITIVSGIRALNNGITLAYDAENYLWYMTEPGISIFPASSEAAGFPAFVTTLLSLVVYSISKHALGKSARIAFCYSIGMFAALAALVSIFELATGNESIVNAALCSIENPAFYGIGFGIVFLLLSATIPAIYERKWTVVLVSMPFVIAGVGSAMMIFSPAYMSLSFLALALIVVAYGIFWSFKNLGKAKSLKLLVVFGSGLAFALVLVYATSFTLVLDKFSNLSTTILTKGEADISACLSAICMKVWKTELWLGTGLGTFAQELRFNAQDYDWSLISVTQALPINAWAYLLLERGIIGLLLIAFPIAFFAWGYVFRAISSVKAFPSPLVLAGPLVAVAVFALSTFSASLFRIETLPLVVLAVTISTNSWVKEKIDG